MSDTVLVVDDEDGVRRTFVEWLTGGGLGCTVLAASDAEEALQHANAGPVDLAVLDWNLGTGNDGLQLLEDLAVFQPDIVAILVTGFAHQATPLRALRMGVRDYLDKTHDLTREAFLAAVGRQLDRIRPAKRHRAANHALAAFRAAVEELVPLARTSAVAAAPVALPEAVLALARFLQQATGATDSALGLKLADGERWFDAAGQPRPAPGVPFADTLAAAAVGMGRACVLPDLADAGGATLLPWEAGRRNLLAVPAALGAGAQAALLLYDKPAGFAAADRQLADAAAVVGAALLKQTLADQRVAGGLLAAVQAALDATAFATATPADPLPAAVRAGLKQGIAETADADGVLELAEAARTLAATYGPDAVRHVVALVRETSALLDRVAGTGADAWR